MFQIVLLIWKCLARGVRINVRIETLLVVYLLQFTANAFDCAVHGMYEVSTHHDMMYPPTFTNRPPFTGFLLWNVGS